MSTEIIPIDRIAQSIYLLRGQKVMLGQDLALLYGVTATDPGTFAALAALLCATAAAATLVAARRATSVDPALALRAE